MNSARYARRRIANTGFLLLSIAAAAFGLLWLALILGELLYQGVAGVKWLVFTHDTPPPMTDGGLRNAIFGSFVMSAIGVVVGTPIGILAGTYLAEYGRHSRLSAAIRFINDIMLSAPSILIGLFVYQLLVLNRPDSYIQGTCTYLLKSYCAMGHFSAFAGSVALSLLVIPVVVSTTENMLILVPNPLREAAAALGTPLSRVISTVTWRAARAGIVTGVLLAVARISGETAPLLFTAFGNQFWTSDLGQPMASLPLVIFNFAMSPYDNWHALAWTGALIITAAVLALSILARVFEGKRSPQ